MKVQILAILLIVTVGLVISDKQDKEPTYAKEGQFPWQISMTWFNPPEIKNLHFCGGAIINRLWALTTGYCITNVPANGTVYIRTGCYNLNKDDAYVHYLKIKQMIVHEQYEGAKTLKTLAQYDIGMIEFETEIEFEKRVQPILMAKSKNWFIVYKTYNKLIVSGWGSTSYGALPDRQDYMRTVNVTTIPDNECENAIRKFLPQFVMSKMKLCTTPLDGSLGACIGDIGGPIIYHEKTDEIPMLIGLGNWNSENCNKNGLPPVYTRIDYFIKWIEKKLEDNHYH